MFLVTIEVEAERMSDVRDLANAVRDGIRSAQKAGRYPDVTITQGPTISQEGGT